MSIQMIIILNLELQLEFGKPIFTVLIRKNKELCVFLMVIVSILPHAEFGPNGHEEDAPHFIFCFQKADSAIAREDIQSNSQDL